MRSLCHILLATGILTGPAFGADGVPIPKSIETFFETHCYDCHDEATSKADLNLEGLIRSIANNTDALNWQDILDQLNAGEMPPKKKPRPPKDELAGVVGDLTEALQAAQKMLKDSGGEIALRRINRREYEATVRELLGIRIMAERFPPSTGIRSTMPRKRSLKVPFSTPIGTVVS
ncbi:MAG: c-type cytochrome domain-containing protein [Akkermansiaceae bacterium]